MSRSVDERIVEMRFDNQQFERGVQTTLGSLDKLKNGLKLEGVSNGLDKVNKSAKGIDVSSLVSGVDSLTKRFSTLGIIGMEVTRKLTDACLSFAHRGLSTVINSIVEGGKRRAMNVENAHFQLQGLLKDEEKVQAVMADAMESVDGTAYAYDEAAKAASQFAASGLQSGDQMLSSLKAITGVAAMTNSAYEDISRVFTTVAGNGRLMGDQLLQLSSRGLNAASTLADYFNKIDDPATKASDDVRKAVKALTKGTQVTEADIREFVSKSKISFEMFAGAMDDAFGEHAKKANETLTGSLSNVRAALAKIGEKFVTPLVVQNGPLVNFFNNLRKAINSVKDEIGPLANLWNMEATKIINKASYILAKLRVFNVLTKGTQQAYRLVANTLQIVKNVLGGIKSVLLPINNALDRFIPDDLIGRIGDFLAHIRQLTNGMRISVDTARQVVRIFTGVFSVFDIAGKVIKGVWDAIKILLGGMGDFGESVLEFFASLGDKLYGIDRKLKSEDITNFILNTVDKIKEAVNKVTETLDKVKAAIDKVVQKITGFSSANALLEKVSSTIKKVIKAIGDFADTHFKVPDLSGLNGFSAKVQEKLAPLTAFGERFRSIFSGLGTILHAVFKLFTSIMGHAAPIAAKFGGMIVDTIGRVVDALAQAVQGEGFNSLLDLLNGGLLVGFGLNVNKFLTSFTKLTKTANTQLKGLGSSLKSGFGISGVFGQLKNSLMMLQKDIKADILKKIAVSIAILAGSLLVLSMIPSDKLTGAIVGISILFQELIHAMNVFTNSYDGGIKSTVAINMAASAMIKIGEAMLILAVALRIIGTMNALDIAKGLVAIQVSLAIMVNSLKSMTGVSKDVNRVAGSLIIFASAMVVLGLALKIMGSMNFEQMATALASFAGSMLIAVMVFKELGGIDTIQTATSMLVFAGAMTVLGIALKIMGSLKFEQMITALAALAGSMLIISMVFSALKNANTVETAASMLIVSTALVILGAALKIMGSLKLEQLGTALAALAGSMLVLMMVFSALKNANTIETAGSILIFAGAMVILGAALKIMGSLNFDQLITSLTALVGSMLVMVLAFKTLDGVKMAATAAGILLMSSALIVLSLALKALGSLSLKELGIAILSIVASFVVLGGLSLVLAPIIPIMLALAAALAIFGVGVLAAGVGVMTLAAGMTALAAASVASAAAIIASLETIIVGILAIIAKTATQIAATLKAVILAIVVVLVECAPELAEGAFQMVLEALRILKDYVPPIVDMVLEILISIIDSLAARIPELIQSIANFVQQIFNGIVEAIKSFSADGLEGALDNALGVAKILAVVASYAVLSAAAGLGVLALASLVLELTGVLAALGAISKIPGLMWFVQQGGDFLQVIGTAIGKFVGGFIGGAMEAVSKSLPGMATDLSRFMVAITPFIAGAMMIKPSMLEGVQTLAETILLLTKANIVDGLTKWLTGGSSLSKFGEELAAFGPSFSKYAASVSGIDPETVTASANAALALAQMADTLPNSGGLAAKIFGDNSLAEFGEELSKFGPYISEYAGSVSGVNPEAVSASVEAAQMLADMANTLPNSGGIAAKILGDNTLSAFGEELSKFGPYISDYASSVSGVTPGSVTASVEAAQMLADMANTLPNQGGMVTWFIGDNTLSMFGSELEKFGPHISAYAASVAGIDVSVITASANAAKALAELANNLPNSGGLVSLFTGSNDIGKFGNSLQLFGAYFSNYYNYISKVSPEVLDSVTAAIGTLIDMATKAGNLDPQALTNFAKDLENMGKKGIDGFVSSFSKAAPQVQTGVKNLINIVKSAMTSQAVSLRTSSTLAGQQLTIGLITGLNDKKPILLSTIKTICTMVIQTINTSWPQSTFMTIGQNTIVYIINGMNNRKPGLIDTVNKICRSVIDTFKKGLNVEALKPVGIAIIKGIIDGLNSNKGELTETAKSLRDALLNALKNVLNADAFKPIGAAAANGIKQGITDKIKEIADAAVDAAKKAVKSAQAAFGDSKDTKSATNAVQTYVDAVEDANDDIKIDAISTAQSVATVLAAAISDEIARPVIRPIIDMSDLSMRSAEIQNGLNAMVSMRLASTADSYKSVNTLSNLTSSLEKIESDGNRNILGAIQELRTDVNALNANMSRLQVVMDSGALVGSIAPAMDSQLGRMAKLKARGV